jgi:hypothetical protein
MKLDTKAIQMELNNLVNPQLTDENGQPIRRRKADIYKVAVKNDKQMATRVGIDFRDHSYGVRLNSNKIRSQGQLDDALAWVRRELA